MGFQFAGTVKDMGDFEEMLPDEITIPSFHSGEELVLNYSHARQAIEMAAEHLIAVLGIEAFQILDSGLRLQTYSAYTFESGVWKKFVEQNNHEASLFLSEQVG